jgi:hypothetical protein
MSLGSVDLLRLSDMRFLADVAFLCPTFHWEDSGGQFTLYAINGKTQLSPLQSGGPAHISNLTSCVSKGLDMELWHCCRLILCRCWGYAVCRQSMSFTRV